MKKYLILLVIIIIIGLFIKIPIYNDLNNIIVIDKVNIKCIDGKYHITLREIKPIKEDNGLSYKYKYHNEIINNLNELQKLNQKKYHNNLYYDKAKKYFNNCDK